MPWVKLDDAMASNRKFRRLSSPEAFCLYVSGLCYAAKYLTDGFLDRGDVEAGLESATRLRNPLALAERLVEAGLWERVEGGFQVHDYLLYNRSREQVLADREAATERQRKFRGHNGVTSSVTPVVTAPDSDASPSSPVSSSPQSSSRQKIETEIRSHTREAVGFPASHSSEEWERFQGDMTDFISRKSHLHTPWSPKIVLQELCKEARKWRALPTIDEIWAARG